MVFNIKNRTLCWRGPHLDQLFPGFYAQELSKGPPKIQIYGPQPEILIQEVYYRDSAIYISNKTPNRSVDTLTKMSNLFPRRGIPVGAGCREDSQSALAHNMGLWLTMAFPN